MFVPAVHVKLRVNVTLTTLKILILIVGEIILLLSKNQIGVVFVMKVGLASTAV